MASGSEGPVILPPAPDGKWGWVVLACETFRSYAVAGVNNAIIGMFYNQLVEYYDTSFKMIGLIQTIANWLVILTSTILAGLINKFGSRIMCFVFMAIATIGCLVLCIAKNLYLFAAGFCLLKLGQSGASLGASVTLAAYFEKRRSTAFGVRSVGAKLAELSKPLIVVWLADSFGWNMSFVFVMACHAIAMLTPLSMKPLEIVHDQDNESIEEEAEESIQEGNTDEDDFDGIKEISQRRKSEMPGSGIEICSAHPPPKVTRSMSMIPSGSSNKSDGDDRIQLRPFFKDSLFYNHSPKQPELELKSMSDERRRSVVFRSQNMGNENEKEAKESTFKHIFKLLVDLSMLQDPVFLVFSLAQLFRATLVTFRIQFLPSFWMMNNMSNKEVASMLSIGMGISIGSTIAAGFIFDKLKVSKVSITCLIMAICSASMMVMYFFNNKLAIIICSFVVMSLDSLIDTIFTCILVELFGMEKLAATTAMCRNFFSIGYSVAPLVLGSMVDKYGNYENILIVVAATQLAGVGCNAAAKFLARRQSTNEQE